MTRARESNIAFVLLDQADDSTRRGTRAVNYGANKLRFPGCPLITA